uniref:Uncharacterized protein n=1 Tax=Anguilla anguilla TaxID=7936 RepID=A0A0E9Q7N2_ANGAN
MTSQWLSDCSVLISAPDYLAGYMRKPVILYGRSFFHFKDFTE